jgi:hypothetical protein
VFFARFRGHFPVLSVTANAPSIAQYRPVSAGIAWYRLQKIKIRPVIARNSRIAAKKKAFCRQETQKKIQIDPLCDLPGPPSCPAKARRRRKPRRRRL